MAVLGLCCVQAFSSYSEWGLLFLVVLGLLIAVASFVAEQTLGTQASVACVAVVANKLSRSAVCGIFPDQRSNPCPLRWQADSLPPSHQQSPTA